ncbi:hypothetical protein AVEN_114286-1 [Araneus ventricosus]|uniref:Uncharacterized protein n=1 Tax=Araneus ventricosus TaxID=182803 RepID=A0A4Y2MNL4_ARAVE|nr:hypothetical protein AVEN_114286-1 [Araneus ventricosus]
MRTSTKVERLLTRVFVVTPQGVNNHEERPCRSVRVEMNDPTATNSKSGLFERCIIVPITSSTSGDRRFAYEKSYPQTEVIIHIEIPPDIARNCSVNLIAGLCNSLSAEAGVLTTITGHGPIPPEGGTHYRRQMSSPNHYCTQLQERQTLSYTAASHLRTLALVAPFHPSSHLVAQH